MAGTIAKSLQLDRDIGLMHDLPLGARGRFIFQKTAALTSLARGAPCEISVGRTRFTVASISDLGTLQSCISDVYEILKPPVILGEDPRILDVGANIGQWTAALKLFRPAASILAVEPNPAIFHRLLSNVGDLTDVDCLQFAVGSRPSTAVLYRQPLSSMSTLHPDATDTHTDPIEVPVRTIDDLVGDRPIDFVKIDVEGGELDAIRGAESVLRRAAYLLVELSLSRGPTNGLATLAEVARMVPKARIVKFGRPLGPPGRPVCQDALISLA